MTRIGTPARPSLRPCVRDRLQRPRTGTGPERLRTGAGPERRRTAAGPEPPGSWLHLLRTGSRGGLVLAAIARAAAPPPSANCGLNVHSVI